MDNKFRKSSESNLYVEYEIHTYKYNEDDFGFGDYDSNTKVYKSQLFDFVNSGNFALRMVSSSSQNFTVRVFQGSNFENISTYKKTFEKTYNDSNLNILENILLDVPSSKMYFEIEFADVSNLKDLIITYMAY